MNKKIGKSERLPCITNETTNDPKHYCCGSMIGRYGGEYYEDCTCGGRVTVSQYMNCTCDKCKTVVPEVFEYCCNFCCNYGLSDACASGDRRAVALRCHRFTVQDPNNECSYSWSGIGYPLAEVDDIGKLNNRVIAHMQQKLSQTETYFEN